MAYRGRLDTFMQAYSVSASLSVSLLALRLIHSASALSESGVNSSQRAVISSGVIQIASLTSSSCRAKGRLYYATRRRV